MFYFLVLIGAIAVAAGVILVVFSIPLRESPLGAGLLVAASVAMTGGFVLIGLAAAVRELRSVARALRALKARAPSAPGPPRPPRPVENWPQERRDGNDRWPASARPPASGRPSVASPADFQPIDLDAPPQAAAPVRDAASEWLRRTMAEIHADRKPAGTETPRADDQHAPNPAPPRTAAEDRPIGAPEIWPWSEHSASPVAPEPTAPEATVPEPPPAPPAAPPEVLTSRPNLLESQQKIFETVWPATRHRHDGGHDRRDKVPAEPPARTAPVAPVVPAVVPETELPTILKTGVIEEMAYTLYSDGSIAARTPDRTMRFRSIDELRQYLDRRET